MSLAILITTYRWWQRQKRRFWQRWTRWPPIGATDWGDLRRLKPISREFGFDRGLPIDRYYIEKFLQEHGTDIQGRVLEIGDPHYTRRFGGDKVTQSDVLHVNLRSPGVTIVADLAAGESIPSEAFDCLILTQTLQLIYDIRAALTTCFRILKPGGVLLATFPGLSKVARPHCQECWEDCWRFTGSSTRRLFGELFPPEQIAVQAHGNVLTATGFFHGLACQELTQEELDYHDPDYEVLITVRAVKPGAVKQAPPRPTLET